MRAVVTHPGIDSGGDQSHAAIAATDSELARLLVADLATLPPNPEWGIQLPKLLGSAGAVDVHVEARPIVVTSLATFRAMRNPDAVPFLAYLVMRRQVEADRAAAFLADLEARDREGAFLATSTMYAVSGRKAATRSTPGEARTTNNSGTGWIVMPTHREPSRSGRCRTFHHRRSGW